MFTILEHLSNVVKSTLIHYTSWILVLYLLESYGYISLREIYLPLLFILFTFSYTAFNGIVEMFSAKNVAVSTY